MLLLQVPVRLRNSNYGKYKNRGIRNIYKTKSPRHSNNSPKANSTINHNHKHKAGRNIALLTKVQALGFLTGQVRSNRAGIISRLTALLVVRSGLMVSPWRRRRVIMRTMNSATKKTRTPMQMTMMVI